MVPRGTGSLVLLSLLSWAACTPEPVAAPGRTLQVMASTSMGPTLAAWAKGFEAQHPDVKVVVRRGSSRCSCLRATQPEYGTDLVLVTDADMLDQQLLPEAAEFSLRFAQNALVLAYAPYSTLARRLQAGDPWQQLLASGHYRLGYANPRHAPVGYRAMLALKLNDRVARPELRLGQRILSKLDPDEQRSDIAHLIEPLQQRQLDAAFIYRSEALQHHLPFVALNRQMDFSDPRLQDVYAQVSLSLPGAEQVRFGGVATYGLAIPKGAPSPTLAAQFVRHMLSPAGRRVAQAFALPLLSADSLQVRGELPESLQPL